MANILRLLGQIIHVGEGGHYHIWQSGHEHIR